MSQRMTATFLGTSSGGGPTESRNCSSLVLDVVGDGSLWSILFHFAQELWLTNDAVIDGAEGTVRQFSLQSSKNAGKTLKVSQVSKIFVTHMHRESVLKCMPSVSSNPIRSADHVMGLPTLLRNILGFPHPEIISPRGTLVGVLFHVSDEPTNPQSHNVAKGQPIRARRPSFLRPDHPFPDTHTNGRPLRGSRAPHPNRSTYALRRRSSP
jgi:hypothetical protein